MMTLVSIVVPVYNAENTIERCIDSLLEQTYENIEIIIINDGSIDNSKEIIDRFSMANKNIMAKHITNEGVSHARNLGITIARGEVLAFIDADDYVSNEYVKELITHYQEDKLTICGYRYIKENCYRDVVFSDEVYQTESNKAFTPLFLNMLINSPWNKLYNKEIIDKYKIRFNQSISMGEDLVFNLTYLRYVTNGFNIVNKTLNYYIATKNSLSSQKAGLSFLHQKELFKQVILFYKTIIKGNDIQLIYDKYIYVLLDLLEQFYTMNHCSNKEFKHCINKELVENDFYNKKAILHDTKDRHLKIKIYLLTILPVSIYIKLIQRNRPEDWN